jgi:hypothetical protein
MRFYIISIARVKKNNANTMFCPQSNHSSQILKIITIIDSRCILFVWFVCLSELYILLFHCANNNIVSILCLYSNDGQIVTSSFRLLHSCYCSSLIIYLFSSSFCTIMYHSLHISIHIRLLCYPV